MSRIAVVAASRRSARLAFLLEALAAQTLPTEQFEVVIARDHSAGNDPPVPEGLDVEFLRPGGPGRSDVGALRDAAWRASKAPLIAFTDDDCRPAPGWLEALLAKAGDDAVLQGRTEPDPDEAHLLHGLARSQRIEAPGGMYETCNIAYPRAVLERIGGFDAAFAAASSLGHGGEDTDLAMRALESGSELRFAPDALVWHAVHTPTLRESIRFAWRWQGIGLAVKRHPALRSAFYARLFSQPSHALWLGGVALTLAPAGLWVALAGWTPYAIYRLGYRWLKRPARLLRGLVYLPQIAIVDGVEIAARLRESVQARTVVL